MPACFSAVKTDAFNMESKVCTLVVYLKKLQSVQTRLLVWCLECAEVNCDITPVLKRLHRLPVSQRVVFKTALMVWKCVHGVAPA